MHKSPLRCEPHSMEMFVSLEEAISQNNRPAEVQSDSSLPISSAKLRVSWTLVRILVKFLECQIFQDLAVRIGIFHKSSCQKRRKKKGNNTQISPCWGVALTISHGFARFSSNLLLRQFDAMRPTCNVFPFSTRICSGFAKPCLQIFVVGTRLIC